MISFRSKYTQFFLFFSFLFSSQFIFSSELLKGDEAALENESFSFPVGQYANSFMDDAFYVVAHPDAAGYSKDFAISKVDRMSNLFVSMAPEKVKLDGQLDQDNPLYNRGIKLFRLAEKKSDKGFLKQPIVVPSKINSGDFDKVYAVDDFSTNRKIEVVASNQSRDAMGNLTFDIEGIETAYDWVIFAAVRNSNSDPFGALGSGIAALQLSYNARICDTENQQQEENKEKPKVSLAISQFQDKAIPLSVGSDLVKIQNNLSGMSFADMHWNASLGLLYIALQTSSGAGANDGAKAIVIGKISTNNLVLDSFQLKSIAASDDVFSGAPDKIVGAIGANSQVSIHKIKSMFTSNRLSYLIVLGGNGDSDSTKRSVFALPLVNNWSDEENHGKLADKDALPEDVFSTKGIIKKFNSRLLKQQAEQANTLLTSSDDAAKVGVGDLDDGDIIDIFVEGDAVYAIVGDPATNYQTGIFMSHALFDKNGKIKRWTEWQRVANPNSQEQNDNIYGADLDAKYGNFLLLTGTASNDVKTVKRTTWGAGDTNGIFDLTGVLNKEFPSDSGGIQGLFEFSNDTPGVENIAILVATGLQKVALVEMGEVVSGVLVRNTGNFASSKEVFDSGKITKNFPPTKAKTVVISGGVLNELGPIEASAVTLETNADQARLFVGGIGGLAVLVRNNGDGWSGQLGPNFAGLADDMVFRKINGFSFVRKLIAEENLLYVLTDLGFFRIDLSDPSNNFVTGDLKITELTPGLCTNATFLDFAVSGNLGLLATSVGLYRTGDGQDISAAQEISWELVNVPKYCGPIKQLFPFSKTTHEQDFAKAGSDGMLYVLGSYYGKNRAQFNRFTISPGAVNSSTILPFPDYFVLDNCTGEGSTSYFVNYGTYRKMLNEDGGLRFSAADRDLCIPPFVKLLLPGITTGFTLPISSSTLVPLSIENSSDVVRILRSATGPVLVAGDFGLKVNE